MLSPARDADAGAAVGQIGPFRRPRIWPFGYSATEVDDVVTVFDAGGSPVATSGVPVQLGGGGGDAIVGGVATGDNRCGATMFWFVASG
jgi:hypothetical protein